MFHSLSCMIDPEVTILLKALPEFTPAYMELVAACDDDPGAAVVLTGLADFVSSLAESIDRNSPVLDRALAGVETVASGTPDADDLVAGAFLESLSPDDIRRLRPRFGPITTELLDEVEGFGTYQ